ncbi:Reversion-inducing cysteine-rich with Kazal motifs [Paramuricea clavata]|uniref:Reversion-inducing cysteine-rich with Kazal motifs n=1 Tax=Paramuricea clavata TaxID=317549 RepID=A0A7D9DJJ6_PARCT|nr:Reversion-inducing cysteine-rich with Kazal motifs [Paramuricea clavata]
MYALFLTVFCTFVVLGSAREHVYEAECCKNIRGIRECKDECEKAWNERDPAKKLQLALSLPKVCPSHLVSLWKCLNSSIKGLHLYAHSNLLKEGKSCCLLGIHPSCRQACFLVTNSDSEDLKKSCKPKDEESLLRCVERNDASRTCCSSRKRKCERACQNVFASNKVPSRKKLKLVKRHCKRKNLRVDKCVRRKVALSKTPDHKCCRMADDEQCQTVCRKAMASENPLEEKIKVLRKFCKITFSGGLGICLLTHSKSMQTVRDPERESGVILEPLKVDVRLHCCLSAKTDKCFKLCLTTYSEGGKTDDLFKRRCEFDPIESTMLTCIADVSQPCHIGCSGLGFCTNFNHRHTELFRSCTLERDNAAKSDYENWLREKRVEIHSMDVVPVKDISTCLPEWWKAVACALQIRPCHVKSHGSTICRSDCLKILGECAEKEKLGVRTVEEICARLSPDDQSSCISLESYLKPSLYKNETDGVTHPCYPNPCKFSKDLCEINRGIPGKNGKNYRCTPGCPIDHQSKTVIKNGDFARLPIVQNLKLEGCFKICRCVQGKLPICTTLPSCIKRNSCDHKLTNKTYKHQEKFSINCNFCVCYDGEVLCSKSQCLPGADNNATGRLRRNHSPNDENTVSDLSCRCLGKYEPVCGTNGKTYRRLCFASNCADVNTKQIVKGQCSSIYPCDPSPCSDDKLCVVDRKVCVGSMSSCPQFICIKRPQNCTNSSTRLLCDTENQQHSSKCEVQRDEKEIAYAGKCNPSCVPGMQEVCGVDGQTYSSKCALKHARMLLDYEGPCKTVGKYGNKDPTVRCAHIKCPILNPPTCVGVTPPGACCEVCATQLTVIFDEKEISKTNKIVMDTSQPITQLQVVARVRRHLSMSECDVFGFYNTYNDFILLVKTITEKPTTLQFLICNKEAQKIETLINTQSPIFTSDEILSSFRAVQLNEPSLSKKLKSKAASSYSSSTLLICMLLTLAMSWTTQLL